MRLVRERRGDDVARTLGISPALLDVLLHRGAKPEPRSCIDHQW